MKVGQNQSEEAVSALVDGELSGAEAERLIDRVSVEPELRARWTRYHAGRAALSGTGGLISPDFAHRVGARLAAEPSITGPLGRRRRNTTGWRPAGKSLTSLAVAATVGVLALGGLLALRDGSSPSSPATPDVDPVARFEPASSGATIDRVAVPLLRPGGLATVAVPVGGTAPRDAELQTLFDEYVTTHAVFSAGGDMSDLIQSGRLAGHQPRQ